jgi:hypothetical protein
MWIEVVNRPVERHAYYLAGLQIDSEIRFNGLVPWDDRFAAAGRVSVTRSTLPETLQNSVREFPGGQCSDSEYLIDMPEIARFLVRDGTEILVEPAPAHDENELRVFLLGSIFGILCHQRGIVPLHASSIDIDGGCASFVGDSGAGKSTLVAALAARGHQVITDDVCFLQFDKDGHLEAWPGIGRIRLWEDALHALSLDGPEVMRETRGFNKYLVPTRQRSDLTTPRRLRKIYQLQAAADDEMPSIARVRGVTAIEILLHNIYRMEHAESMGRKAGIFDFCSRMTRQLQVLRFSRPKRFDLLQPGIDLLMEDIRST